MPKPKKALGEYADRQVPKISLSIDEAAWSLGVCRNTLDRMMSEGQLPYALIRSKPVIDPEDLRRMIREHKVLRNAPSEAAAA